MKDVGYVMKVMSTYDILERNGCETMRKYKKDGNITTKRFQYPETIRKHFDGRHSVGDHNNCHHAPISLEQTWATKWWPPRVMAFILSITEVNVNLAHAYFCKNKDTLSSLEFTKKMAYTMLMNNLNDSGRDADTFVSPTRKKKKKDSALSGHSYMTIPNFKGRWNGKQWTNITL